MGSRIGYEFVRFFVKEMLAGDSKDRAIQKDKRGDGKNVRQGLRKLRNGLLSF